MNQPSTIEDNDRMEEKTPAAGTDESSHIPSISMKMTSNNRLWWGILSVYLLLFLSTGYLAFMAKDVNPALDMGGGTLTAKLADSSTREFIIATLKQEAQDHKKKTDFAAQSFDVVLGSLLGFLSASAVSRITTREEAG
ncbi:MAG: hypothetical protein JWQ98_1392 [Chlorobi bacterium]|nr:hypothetical protein [Chlorobiota bacterium]